MKSLFKILEIVSTTIIFIILVKSFGLLDWRTWTIYILVYLSMLFDFCYEFFENME